MAEQVRQPLSQVLRASTGRAHKELELRLALPDSIRTFTDYRACLLRFYQLYKPVEMQFQQFPEWLALGIDTSGCSLSAKLAADLQALNVYIPDIFCAPLISLPPLHDFASALGAFYVLEGSALGSQFMLPQLHHVLGDALTGVESFFRGRGAETSTFWMKFRGVLDCYGHIHPEQSASIVSSAIATFNSIGLWMCP